MSTLFNLTIPFPEKHESIHPWKRTIKVDYVDNIKFAHNSIRNPQYAAKIKKDQYSINRKKFTIIGNRVTKEFIYCVNLVEGLHKYRKKNFDAPVIKGVTSVEWPSTWSNIKIEYGGLAYCLRSQVAVILNDEVIGGEKELKELIETQFIYHLCLDYHKHSLDNFVHFYRSTKQPFAYMHISINSTPAGCMIFMLYADVVPLTCENFLRLCHTTRGGYSGTPVHRIVKDAWIQCGGFYLKSTDLSCENFVVDFDKRGVIAMANEGRDKDCSTQFFVLLQPQPWMKYKYVAFGQLVDGEETLKKIENISTLHEAPEANIKITSAGILNLEYDDIKINPSANSYIQGHIEDLVDLGKTLYEELLEIVFLVCELHEQTHVEQMINEGTADSHSEYSKSSNSSHTENATTANPEMTLEVYEPEEYHYDKATPSESVAVREERLYYLPLTDVPCLGDVDSTFDLKKFVRGDYCLERDLEPSKVVPGKRKRVMECTRSGCALLSSPPYHSSSSLDSDEVKEIEEYLACNTIADDELRKIRLTAAVEAARYEEQVQTQHSVSGKKLSIHKRARAAGKGSSAEIHMSDDEEDEAKTRTPQTRVSHSALRKKKENGKTSFSTETPDNIYDSEAERRASHLKVSLKVPSSGGHVHTKIQRRATTYIPRSEALRLTQILDSDQSDSDNSDEADDDGHRKVRISANLPMEHIHEGLSRPSATDDAPHRESVLARLYEDVKPECDRRHTLMDYKSTSDDEPNVLLKKTNVPTMLTTDETFQEKYYRYSLMKEDIPVDDQMLNILHGNIRISRKISSDYVRTIEPTINKPTINSFTIMEFAKTRPMLTVEEYQEKYRPAVQGVALRKNRNVYSKEFKSELEFEQKF